MNEIPVPEALQPFMPMIVGAVTAVLILVLGWMVAKWMLAGVASLLRSRTNDELLSRFVATLVQYLVFAAAVITALARVGVETLSLVALLGSAGLAIGLALQGSLSHLASGVLVILFRPFNVGDSIEGGGRSGVVTEVGLFATVLTTPENHRVVVPNGAIMSNAIVNFTVLGTRRARFELGVAYGSDIERVTELLREAASSVEGILDDPAVGVMFNGFGASSLDFAVHVWAPNETFFSMQPKVRQAIYDKLRGAGIDIPFNQIVVHQA